MRQITISRAVLVKEPRSTPHSAVRSDSGRDYLLQFLVFQRETQVNLLYCLLISRLSWPTTVSGVLYYPPTWNEGRGETESQTISMQTLCCAYIQKITQPVFTRARIYVTHCVCVCVCVCVQKMRTIILHNTFMILIVETDTHLCDSHDLKAFKEMTRWESITISCSFSLSLSHNPLSEQFFFMPTRTASHHHLKVRMKDKPLYGSNDHESH